jgi:sulfate transport system substrate-binding protein
MHPLSKPSVRFTALFVTAGVGLSAAIPVFSAGLSSHTSHTQNQTVQDQKAPQLVSQKPRKEILLVSYAVTKAAYDKIIPKFVEKWKREKGQDVTINTSYGGSGSQTRAVLDGLQADVSALALALDTKRLEKASLIQPGWEKELPNEAIVTRSVISLVNRPGNHKQIRT